MLTVGFNFYLAFAKEFLSVLTIYSTTTLGSTNITGILPYCSPYKLAYFIISLGIILILPLTKKEICDTNVSGILIFFVRYSCAYMDFQQAFNQVYINYTGGLVKLPRIIKS